MQAKIANFRQRWDKATLTKSATFWIAVGAVVLTIFLGFSRGGWVTEVTAQQMAETASQDVIVERLTPFCINQFNQDSQQAQKLEELKGFSSSLQRARFVSEQGWATAPGESATPDDKVASECARQILLLGQ